MLFLCIKNDEVMKVIRLNDVFYDELKKLNFKKTYNMNTNSIINYIIKCVQKLIKLINSVSSREQDRLFCTYMTFNS